MNDKKELSSEQREDLLGTLQMRFEENMQRHKGLDWVDVYARLETQPGKLWSLSEMERTGGEPDVIGRDEKTGEIIFCDCSKQTPAGRRNICYDNEALEARKKFKPENSAMNMAAEMGIKMLTEEEYRLLQTLGEFDTTTSSWVVTPPSIRKLGGATFCDRRFDHVFLYHNGADSYYGVRGFRGLLRV
jgi:hypothetical protein